MQWESLKVPKEEDERQRVQVSEKPSYSGKSGKGQKGNEGPRRRPNQREIDPGPPPQREVSASLQLKRRKRVKVEGVEANPNAAITEDAGGGDFLEAEPKGRSVVLVAKYYY